MTAGAVGAGRAATSVPEPGGEPTDVSAGHGSGGLADAVVASIAVYVAATFPFTPSGVSEAEQMARRTVAHQLAAHEALPDTVRGAAAAAAVEAIDVGRTASAPGPR